MKTAMDLIKTVARMRKSDDADDAIATVNRLIEEARKIVRRKPPELWVLVQEGGSSDEVYVHTHDSEASANRHAKECEKAAYNVLAIERVSP